MSTNLPGDILYTAEQVRQMNERLKEKSRSKRTAVLNFDAITPSVKWPSTTIKYQVDTNVYTGRLILCKREREGGG